MTMPPSTIGSDFWLGADEYELDDPLRTRATTFFSETVQWPALIGIASKQRGGMACHFHEKYSIGHFNLVRQIVFADGVQWVARLRLPDDGILAGRELLSGAKSMEIEVASMKFLKMKTSIPVPSVFSYDTAIDNAVGAPYILMEYLHGSVASELCSAKSCAPMMFGTPEQDLRFREQMAQIQATVASYTFPQIGSLYYNQNTDEFYTGPELQTGKGPWSTSDAYYDDLTSHLLRCASEKPELARSPSYSLPAILNYLMRVHGEEKAGPFRLTNSDFGAHNILVDDNFNIVGVIDFDGMMAAPLEVVAQFPSLTHLDVAPPYVAETRPLAIQRMEMVAPKLKQYKELLQGFLTGDAEKVADRLESIPAAVYSGMADYAQYQKFVNKQWMKSSQEMLLRHYRRD